MSQESSITTSITTNRFSNIDHLNQFKSGVRDASCRISNPIMGKSFEYAVSQSLKQVLSENSRKADINSFGNQPKMSKICPVSVRNFGYRVLFNTIKRTIFGDVHFIPKPIRAIREYLGEECIDEEQSWWETTIIVHPASWVIQCGLGYSLVMTNGTSERGYSFNLSMPRTVSRPKRL